MASIVQRIWREGSRTSDTTSPTLSSFPAVLPSNPTAGNLLVMYAVGRNASAAPTITFAGGSSEVVTVAKTASPMEFHTIALGYRVVQSGDSKTWTANFSNACHSQKIGIVEFDLMNAVLDKVGPDPTGSGATNVSSYPTGSTGTLTSATGLWVSVGTSRTASAGLSHDAGGALLFSSATHHDDATAGGTNATDPHDHDATNSAAAWANLASTAALNVTWSNSTGASRMGAIIAVFIEDPGGGPEPARVGPQVVMFA